MNIENKKQIATIVLAIGLGLVAAFLTAQYVKNEIQKTTKKLAREYQKKNAVLIKELELMKRNIKALAQKQKQLAKKQEALKLAKVQKVKGQPVVQMAAFSVKTPPGKRAYTVMIDSLSAVGGLINPGDTVDILSHLKIPRGDGSGKKNTVTTVLFQNIPVLAVGTNFRPIGVKPRYAAQQKSRSLRVTLALTPEEVSLMSFAQKRGKMQLALRSPTETGTILMQVANWQALADYVLDRQGTELKIPKPKEKEEKIEFKEKLKPAIQIFRGGQEL